MFCRYPGSTCAHESCSNCIFAESLMQVETAPTYLRMRCTLPSSKHFLCSQETLGGTPFDLNGSTPLL